MLHWSLVLFFAVSAIPVSKSQNFLSECPNLIQDILGCSSQFLNATSIKGFFSDFSKVFNFTSLLSRENFCQSSTKTLVFNFYGCVYDKLLACIPSEWQRAFPSLDQTKKALDYMCNNINDVDFACLASQERSKTLVNCVLAGNKGGSDLSTPDGHLTYICSLTQLSESCVKTAYGTCPKKTGDVLAEVERLGKPAGCDAAISQPSILLLLFSVLSFMLAWLK